MNFIHSLTQDRADKSDYNMPVNLDYVVHIYPKYYKNSNDEYYCIEFHCDHHEIVWCYNDELTRDNRLKEILEHIKSRGI